MATESNKPSVLRLVKRDPTASANEAPKVGIAFERVAETKCSECKAAVPLTDAEPLSTLPCPSCGAKVFVPGRLGGFLLYARVGEGEMGAIYRATDESLGRNVAIKLVRGCHADDADSLERLRREARAAGKLNHPRVAQVYALNFSNGFPYLVMELVTGEDFAKKLTRERRLDERTVLRMALDVADGLSALHREGLVHGDIKPANIVLDRDGNAKLVDFGLSGMLRRDANGGLVGTPDYIAPEILRGSADTHSSDIYSLGATLYHLLAGRPSFDGNSPSEVVKARMTQQPVPLGTHAPHVSFSTQKLVMRMLESAPSKRFIDSDKLAVEIRSALQRLEPSNASNAGAEKGKGRFLSRFRLFRSSRLSSSPSPSHRLITALLCLVAAVELVVAFRTHSFEKTRSWFRKEVAKRETPPVQPPAAAVSQPSESIALETAPTWQSTNLGEHTQGGSTMQMGGTFIVQGTGTDMWKGYDRCRFVSTKVTGSYALSAQVKAIADNDGLAVSGLLVKGDDPSTGPGLLFGFLGSGELVLQSRQPRGRTDLIKRSGGATPLPTYLKLVRRDQRFEALTSADGRTWSVFAACELELPPCNTVGFSVSAQTPNTLATAKFADIHLLTSGEPAAQPAGAR